MTKKKNPWRKRILLGGLAVVIILAIVYIIVATEKFAPTKERKAAFTTNAITFIREFRANDSLANSKYREKIITVNGIVSELEAPDTATVNVKFVDPDTGDYAIFAFQEQYRDEARTLKQGDSVSVKGSCSGSFYSETLDAYNISFKRSTLNK